MLFTCILGQTVALADLPHNVHDTPRGEGRLFLLDVLFVEVMTAPSENLVKHQVGSLYRSGDLWEHVLFKELFVSAHIFRLCVALVGFLDVLVFTHQ